MTMTMFVSSMFPIMIVMFRDPRQGDAKVETKLNPSSEHKKGKRKGTRHSRKEGKLQDNEIDNEKNSRNITECNSDAIVNGTT